MKKEKQIADILIKYYEEEGRNLPWRQNANPYRVWISEIMLQQTRVEAVKSYYTRFIRELPDIQSLAKVDDDYLMTLWEGLGYYSRARNLKKCAIECCEKWNGELPRTAKELESLPGIGKYTAAAIASFCYGENIAALDGNGLHVFARLYGIEENVLSKKGESQIRELMQKSIDYAFSADLNQAVMDFASAICTPKASAKCSVCPLRKQCKAYEKGLTSQLPIRLTKTSKKEEYYTVLVYRYQDEICLEKREKKGLLAGLYGFPMVERVNSKTEVYEKCKNFCDSKDKIIEIGEFTHVFSHKIWKMNAFMIQCKYRVNQQGQWVKLEDIVGQYALPSAYSYIFARLVQL